MTTSVMYTFAVLNWMQHIGNFIDNYPLFFFITGLLTAMLFAYYDKAHKVIEKSMKMRNGLRCKAAYKATSFTLLGVCLVMFGFVFLT